MLEYGLELLAAAMAGAKYEVDNRRFGLYVPGNGQSSTIEFFFFIVPKSFPVVNVIWFGNLL